MNEQKKDKEKMKILITGGNGFLGKPITEFLLENGYEVIVLDIETNNLNPHSRLKIIQGNFEESEIIDKATVGVDVIYHLALNFSERRFSLST